VHCADDRVQLPVADAALLLCHRGSLGGIHPPRLAFPAHMPADPLVTRHLLSLQAKAVRDLFRTPALPETGLGLLPLLWRHSCRKRPKPPDRGTCLFTACWCRYPCFPLLRAASRLIVPRLGFSLFAISLSNFPVDIRALIWHRSPQASWRQSFDMTVLHCWLIRRLSSACWPFAATAPCAPGLLHFLVELGKKKMTDQDICLNAANS